MICNMCTCLNVDTKFGPNLIDNGHSAQNQVSLNNIMKRSLYMSSLSAMLWAVGVIWAASETKTGMTLDNNAASVCLKHCKYRKDGCKGNRQ